MGKLAALERQYALGLAVKRPAKSAFEQDAREWKRKKSAVGSRNRRPMPSPTPVAPSKPKTAVREEHHEALGKEERKANAREQSAFQEVTEETMSKIHQSKTNHAPLNKTDETKEAFNWKPFQSSDNIGQKKGKSLNTASVALIARKLMAKEWAMALGRGQKSTQNDGLSMERAAEKQRQEKIAQKEKKEIEEKRVRKQRKSLKAALQSFGRALLETQQPVTPETAEPLLKAAFADVGDFINITWQEKGCRIFLEPWEEKRLRQKQGQVAPTVFQAVIDDNLSLSSYERIEDPEVLQETQNQIILNTILSSFKASTEHDINTLEDAVAEAGRIIQSTKTDGHWKIKLEPWEEMRKRNVGRGGRPPIVTYIINADENFEQISCNKL